MSEPIILVAKVSYSDGQSVRTIGVSDAPYFGNAAGLDGGCWWPLLDPESDQGWGESARHPWQGQSDPFRMGDLTLINTGRHFDAWTRYTVAGLVTELQRGPASAVWNDEPDRFDTFHPGKLEPVWRAQGRTRRFEGRERMILSFESLLAPLAGALNTEVFDDETANETLINRPVPLVLGNVFQVRPALADPSILAYVAANNLAVTHSVAEGGNSSTPVWIALPQGHQLLQSPTLQITADISGPPLVDPDEAEDVLEGMGDFDNWAAGELDIEGLTVTTSSGAAVTEGADSDSAVIAIDPDGDIDTGWLTGNALNQVPYPFLAASSEWGSIVSEFTPPTAAMLENDDASGARVFPGSTSRRSYHLRLTELGVEIDPASIVTGVEIDLVARKENTTPNAFIDSVGMVFDNGTLAQKTLLQETLTDSKETYVFGGDDDLYGRNEITGQQVNADDFGLFFAVGTLTEADWIRVYRARMKIYYTVARKGVEFRWADVLTEGERYTLTIETLDDDGSLRADWSDSVAADDPFSARNSFLTGGTISFVFTAGASSDFVLRLTRFGNGTQEINSIRLRKSSGAQDTLDQLVPWIVNHVGLDPEQHVVQSAIDAHAAATGMARLGWLVANSETADDVLALLAGSLGGMLWHDRGGRIKSMLLQPPDDSDDDILYIEDNRINGEIEIWDDTPEGMTDRANAATNWHPIAEDRTAGTLSDQEKANVAASHRVVRRAKFPDLEGFTPAPTLTLASIDPNTGDEAGGDVVTLDGTGFAEFDTGEGHSWTIGGEPVTNITVVSDTEMTGETPAGTGESDVVVTIGEDSATLVGGFTYEAALK